MTMISRTLFFDLPLSFILFHYVYVLRMNRQNAASDPADINLEAFTMSIGITLKVQYVILYHLIFPYQSYFFSFFIF